MVCRICVVILLVFMMYAHGVCDEWDVWDQYELERWNLHIHTKLSRDAWYQSYDLVRAFISYGGSLDHLTADSPEETLEKCQKLGFHPGFSDHVKFGQKEFDKLIKLQEESVFNCLAGFELSLPGKNHLNIFGANKIIATDPQIKDAIHCSNIKELLDNINNMITAIIQINHIYYISLDYQKIKDFLDHPEKPYPINNWDNYKKFNKNPRVCLMELSSKLPTYLGIKYHLIEYFKALREIKVAPTNNEDNFGFIGKSARVNHTAIFCDKNHKNPALMGLRYRHTFASEDANFELRFMAKTVDSIGSWNIMGDEVVMSAKDKLMLALKLYDPDEPIGEVRIIAVCYDKAKIIVRKKFDSNFGTYHMTIKPNLANTICLLVLVIQNDENYIVSAPIWISQEDDPPSPITYSDLPPSALPTAAPTVQKTVTTPDQIDKYVYEKSIIINDDVSSMSVKRGNIIMNRSFALYRANRYQEKAEFVKKIGNASIDDVKFAQFTSPGVVSICMNYISQKDKHNNWEYNQLIHYDFETQKGYKMGQFIGDRCKTNSGLLGNILLIINILGRHDIKKINTLGNIICERKFNDPPVDAAFDIRDNIYVLFNPRYTQNYCYIEKYDQNFQFIKELKIPSIKGSDVGKGRNYILTGNTTSICIDMNNNIYVAWWNGYIQKFDKNMRYICGFPTIGGIYQMRVDDDGRIYCLAGHTINIYRPIR